MCCTKTRTLMASSPGIRDCDKVGIQNPQDCSCVLVETSCVSTTPDPAHHQDKCRESSQNTNGLGLYRDPPTPSATSRQSQHRAGWLAGKIYRNLKFDQTRENILAIIAALVCTVGCCCSLQVVPCKLDNDNQNTGPVMTRISSLMVSSYCQ